MTDRDWRLDGMERHFADLHGRTLLLVEFEPSENWDHEHCAFCWEKLAGPGVRWYLTEDGRDWICPVCFEDFKERFGWKVLLPESE